MDSEFVRQQHASLDRFIARWRSQNDSAPIYCGKGCSDCCNLAVHATLAEAVVISRSIDATLLYALDEYLDRLTTVIPQISEMKDYLRAHRQQIGHCPFLTRQGECGIYDLRPTACRALLSSKTSGWCAVDISSLDPWDKQLYENNLDLQMVAWPTHYIAATQDFGRELEAALMERSLQDQGWALSGNLAVLVWLAKTSALDQGAKLGLDDLLKALDERGLAHPMIINTMTHE